MSTPPGDPATLLHRSLERGRIHSAYLLSGPGNAPRRAALDFVRGLACVAETQRPCGRCSSCRRSEDRESVTIDGTGKRGPRYRHVGDHPDLLWVERGARDTRVRIGQIRAVQNALRLGANEGGWRAVVIADAAWLNQEAQNALLRLLEEPPDKTCLVLVATSAAGLLATIRSRCQRIAFPAAPDSDGESPEQADEVAELVRRFDALGRTALPELLDWAEEYRGERAAAAQRVHQLIETGLDWLRRRVGERVRAGGREVRAELDAFKALSRGRRDLDQHNANPQIVAERTLLAVQGALQR